MLIDQIRGEDLDEFFESLLILKTVEECYKFFDDLCTVKEMNTMFQRFKVAKALYYNKTYQEIEEGIGASAATISRVKRSLYHGNNMYDVVFDRMQAAKQESQSETTFEHVYEAISSN
ncbi:YerC/YecD family TrpR-related protein [Niallia oryzisoli]|uniref:YerC/YecD family TrpR-related protein n=1 Tax=Niallia oryzisoli TaxID=1737571 RepID=UPI003735DDAB